MTNIFGLLCVSRSPGLRQPRNRGEANRIVLFNAFSGGGQVSLLTSVSRQGKKVPPVFRLDKTSAPPSLTESRARKWDYGEYPPTGTCSIVTLSSTQNKELCWKTKFLSLRFPSLFSLLCPHLPFFHPTFVSPPTSPPGPISPLPPFLFLIIFLSLTSSQIPSPLPSPSLVSIGLI